MAGRKPKTNAPDPADALANIEMTGDPLADFFAQYPNANRKFKIGRYENGSIVHLFSTSDLIDEDALQDQYPEGGRFIIRAYEENALRGSTEIRIAGKPGHQSPPNDSERKIEVSNAEPGKNDSLAERLLFKIMGMGPSAMAANVPTPVNELAEAIKTLHSLNGSGGGGVNAAKEFIEAFKLGMEMGRTNGGTELDWKTEAFRMLKDVIPSVAAAIPAITGKPAATPAPTREKMIETLAIPGAEADKIMYDGIQKLKGMCMSHAPVDLIIDWVIANAANAEYQNFIRSAFTREFESFVAIDSEIGKPPFDVWFKSLYDGLRSAFNEANEVDDDRNGGNGDPRDVTNHANAGDSGKSIA